MECSEEDIYTITGYEFDWMPVGRRLLSDQKVMDIDREGGSEGEKREKMLLKWKKIKSRDATFQALVKVLRAIENNATADRVEDLERKSQGLPRAAQTSHPATLASSEIVAGDIILNDTDVIGEGAQGCVYKAFWKSKQKPVAVKKIGSLSNAAKREIETLKSVRHKNIVLFYGVYEITPQRCCLVLELADTSLDQHLKRSTPSLEQSLNWAEQVGQGMQYLHYDAPETVIHGDLKSSNVLVYSDEVLKIGDFGSSKFKAGQQSSVTRVTIQWTAPELFGDGKHSMESDVYAFGILLWEMVTHKVPYEGLREAQIISRVTKNQHPEIPSSCNKTLREIFQKCWKSEPKNRPSFKIVLRLLEAAKSGESQSQQKLAKELTISEMTGDGSSTSVHTCTLKDLMNDFASNIPAKWRSVGIQLGLSSWTLDNIQAMNAGKPQPCHDSFEQVFTTWEQFGPSPYTWNTISEVLRTPAVGEVALADELEFKHMKSMP